MPDKKKATIVVIGEIDPHTGEPVGWVFEGGDYAAFDIGDHGRILRYAGYTVSELEQIARKEKHQEQDDDQFTL